jgi:phosphoglycerate dehydrogenase-like enzyme
LKVHLLNDYGELFKSNLEKKVNFDLQLTVGKKLPKPAEYKILIAGVPEEEHITASKKLTTLIIPWAGLPKPTAELMKDYNNIAIHNTHYNASTTAEMAVSLMTTAMKRLIPIDNDFRKNDWSRRYSDESILILEGKNVLVLGYGAIGKRVAEICKSFEMNVNIVKRKKNIKEANIFCVDELESLLPHSNVLMMCLPLTKETKGVIGQKELKLLPDNSTIVNVSRGDIIDEKALFDELKSGRLRAGIDVWYSYPKKEEQRSNCPPSQYPFHELDNVVMTPHLAGHSEVDELTLADALAELLNLANEGKTLPNRIDLELGY